MQAIKEWQLHQIELRAVAEARQLAGEFARAASEDREAILAALETELWLAESCADARRVLVLYRRPQAP